MNDKTRTSLRVSRQTRDAINAASVKEGKCVNDFLYDLVTEEYFTKEQRERFEERMEKLRQKGGDQK